MKKIIITALSLGLLSTSALAQTKCFIDDGKTPIYLNHVNNWVLKVQNGDIIATVSLSADTDKIDQMRIDDNATKVKIISQSSELPANHPTLMYEINGQTYTLMCGN